MYLSQLRPTSSNQGVSSQSTSNLLTNVSMPKHLSEQSPSVSSTNIKVTNHHKRKEKARLMSLQQQHILIPQSVEETKARGSSAADSYMQNANKGIVAASNGQHFIDNRRRSQPVPTKKE